MPKNSTVNCTQKRKSNRCTKFQGLRINSVASLIEEVAREGNVLAAIADAGARDEAQDASALQRRLDNSDQICQGKSREARPILWHS